MKYKKPELEIVEFECNQVITQVSIVPGESVEVPGVDVPSQPF